MLEQDFDIPITSELESAVSTMCNLSQGILEKGEARGEAKGEARGEEKKEAKIILNMYKKGYTLEQIADVTDKSAEEIEAIIEKGCLLFNKVFCLEVDFFSSVMASGLLSPSSRALLPLLEVSG